MRVAHIIKVILAAGAEKHLLTLLSGLRARDIDASLTLLVEPDKPMDDYINAVTQRGIPVERLTIHRDLDFTLYSRLRDRLRQLKPDVVHTHLLHADLYGIPAARWGGVPVVVSSRHNDNAFRRRPPFKQVNRFLWRLADGGIAISDAIAGFTVEVEGAPPARIHRIYYGLEPIKPLDRAAARKALIDEWGMKADVVLVGIVCRLIEQKGITYGLQAFARSAPQFPDARLLIVGDGILRKSLENEAQTLGIADRVYFLGWREDIASVMASLDVFLAPSLWEGFGLVLLEAMGQAAPIIATQVSAIPEIVADGETGLLVPPRDVDALADALTRLLSDKPLRQHMGLLGQDRLETHFSAARMVDETAALYRKLLDNRMSKS
jgi:glycosyltransferase involved in cell wall biosynthesis